MLTQSWAKNVNSKVSQKCKLRFEPEMLTQSWARKEVDQKCLLIGGAEILTQTQNPKYWFGNKRWSEEELLYALSCCWSTILFHVEITGHC